MKKKLALVNSYVLDIVHQRRSDLSAFKTAEAVCEDSVESRHGISQYEDLLSLYMRYAERQNLPDFDDSFLRDVVINFIIAGRDTTACALTWMMMLLCQHPEVEKRILQELEELDAPEPIPYDWTQKLVWTSAFFFEACRLYPPVFVDRKSL